MLNFSKNKTEVFLILVIILCAALLIFFNFSGLTGHVISQGSTPSNVSIAKYLAITFGTNLAQGIQFGNVAFLPATNINASHNYDGASNDTTYFINVSNDSSSAVDFCIKANANLTSLSGDVIGLANETYSDSNLTNSTIPKLSNQTSLTINYTKTPTQDVNPGNTDYWRFWLDIPSAQPSGNYNNTIFFKGVSSGLNCSV